MIKTGKELATACLDVATNYKTLYVMGCFGAPMNVANKARYTQNHKFNRKLSRVCMINAASSDTFGFDCVNLIKGLLWGWKHDRNQTYGGAKFASNGVPDTNADGMICLCKDVSTDFSRLSVGEVLWMSGHVGVYIGDGLAVECTPEWKNCVQVTAVHNLEKKSGYKGRKWTKHGKLPYVTYEETVLPEIPAERKEAVSGLPLLKKGSMGSSVTALQYLLLGYGYFLGSCGADGDFGPATENAVEAFQEDVNIEADGKVGPVTWAKLLGV